MCKMYSIIKILIWIWYLITSFPVPLFCIKQLSIRFLQVLFNSLCIAILLQLLKVLDIWIENWISCLWILSKYWPFSDFVKNFEMPVIYDSRKTLSLFRDRQYLLFCTLSTGKDILMLVIILLSLVGMKWNNSIFCKLFFILHVPEKANPDKFCTLMLILFWKRVGYSGPAFSGSCVSDITFQRLHNFTNPNHANFSKSQDSDFNEW